MSILEVNKLTLRFGGLTAVNDLSFRLEEHAIMSLIGPNGAGKTSAFNCLTGFYKATVGEILFLGRSIAAEKPHRITKMGIARTFQNVRLFKDMTVLENVMSGMHTRSSAGILAAILRPPGQIAEEKRIRQVSRECLDFVGIEDKADRLARNLAYGDQRRVEWARALATQPKLLLLDEPAAGLNQDEKNQLVELIQKIRNTLGITVLLIEHDMGLVMKVSEKIVVIDYGEKIAEGTAEAVKNNPRVIEAYLGKEDES
ncbi:Putative ABC transporter [Acididesulfobacillus acetoxydans]|uniref:ABC transporter n=1 Tax=Acididesulfobacillus acetoxydans TaxID=1561005 RepID=A0A8S0WN26_9FIRM|nr:ABC transporter ATP-binding protein [Acididesulfobacillus acetoxydans]CAA7600964.1 Putative ABC transporter [Acididesulfobacillus acetoxydans]CEJ07687.1 High-affinity branched-chain amino acid transport ATP-binding protein LivG [Acididesulfobacillus acetoxydans]